MPLFLVILVALSGLSSSFEHGLDFLNFGEDAPLLSTSGDEMQADTYDTDLNLKMSSISDEIVSFENTLLEHHIKSQKRFKRDTEIEVSWTIEAASGFDVGNATVLKYFYLDGEHFLICGQYQSDEGSYLHYAEIFQWDTDTFVNTGATFETSGVSIIQTHFVNDKLLIAVMNSRFEGDLYEGISRILVFDAETLTSTTLQTVLTHGTSGAHFFDYEGETYLVITNLREDGYAKYDSYLRIFRYEGSYFDQLVSHPTSGACDTISFTYEGFVYLVIGQYIDNDGNYDVGSPVYLFDSENEELLLIQIIQTSAVIDLEYFQIGFEIYLAVACQRDSVTGSYDTNSYIFWWSGSQFIRYQSIPSYGARMWHYQLLEGEDSLLFLTEMQYPEVVRVFEFDDDNDWVETHVLFEATDGDKTTVAMETFPIDDVIYLALSRNLTASDDFNTYQSNFFSFIEGPKEVPVVPIDAIIECHDYIETHWNKSRRGMHDVYATLNETFKEYGDQEFVGPLALSGDLSVLNIFTVVNLTVEGDHDFNIDPTFIAQVEKNNENLLDLRSWFPNLVSLTGDHVIQGFTVFQSAVDVTDTTIGNISTIYFGGVDLDVCVSVLPDGYTVDDISSCEGLIDVEGIGANALSLNGDQTIDSHVVFEGNVTVHGNVTVNEKINGLDVPDDLLLTFSDQVVEGLITFDSNVTFQSNAWVKGQVNNLNLTSDVVTTSEPSSIGGFKTFNSDVKLEDETRVHDGKTVDQVDLSEFKTMVVLLDELNYIHGNLTFLNETVIEGDVNLANEKINNVNVTLLAEQAVVQSTTQTITGIKYLYGDLVAESDVNVDGEVNGINLPFEVVPLATDQIVSTPIKVDNLTCDASIEVDGTVNGLDISEDVLLISTNQTISGRVNFTQAVTMDESNILFPSGVKIDSVDVSELDLSTVKLTGPQIFAGKITFAETVKASDDIVVDGLINGVNISALNDVALSKSKSQVIPDDLSIVGNLAINSALIVNGTMDNLTTADFIPVDGDTTISGHKSFNDDMTVKGDITLDDGERVNCEDLTDLASVILLSTGEQTMYASDVWFSGKVHILGNLTLEGFMHNLEGSIYLSEGVIRGSDLIYDFDLSSVVTLNGEQNITGTKIFHKPVTVFGNMSCTDVNVTGNLQDIPIDIFYYYAVVNDSDRTIEGQKSFSSMTVNDNLNVTGTVDGVDLEVFDNTVVTLDGNQEITGNWMINSSARFKHEVGIKETLNEIDIISKHDDTVCREPVQTVKGLKKIIGDVSIIGHLNTDGLINDLDIEELNTLYLSKTKKQTLKERKVVLEAAACYDIFLSDGASFDGVAPEDLALASVDTSIMVTVSFSDDVIMLQDLFVGGFINDVDVVELKNTAVWKNIPQNISGVKIFTDRFSVIGNVTTPALVNNIDISELALQAIGLADNATIDVPIFFYGSVKVLGDWNMTGLFHLVDINFLIKDAMLTVGNQTISGDKYFEDPSEVTISTLEVLSDLRTDAQTDGISLRSLLNDTVTASTEQTIEGEVTFTTDVSMDSHMIVSSSVDGIDISEKVVLISGEQTIAAMTTFKKGFRVLGNLSVSGLVDTVNLEEFDNTRFSLTMEQEVEGVWTFEKDIYIENMVIFGKINDIDPVMDLVYKDRNHTITGQKNFVGLVVIEGDAEIITVNGINLYDISNIVLTKGEFHLSDEKTFSSNVTILGDVLRSALVDGFDLPYLWWLQLITSSCLDYSLYTYEHYLSHLCYPVYSLSMAAEGQSIALQYFEDWAEVSNHAAAKVSVGQLEGAKLLAVSESYMSSVPRCIQSELYVCPDDEKECWKLTGNDTLPGSQSIELSVYNGSTFIIATPSPQSAYCADSEVPSQTMVYTLEDASFIATLDSPGAIETASIVVEGEFYIAVANFKNPTTGRKITNSLVFKYDRSNQTFSLLQEIETNGAEGVSSLYDGVDYWIAFANGNDKTYSRIYRWSRALDRFTVSGSVATTYASDVLLFTTGYGMTFALFSNEMKTTVEGVLEFDQPIGLYKFENSSGWLWEQFIESPQTIDMALFQADDTFYLAAVSRQGIINIFQWTLPTSFQPFISFPMEGAERVQAFIWGDDVFLAITRPRYSMKQHMSSGVKILRAVTRGKKKTLLQRSRQMLHTDSVYVESTMFSLATSGLFYL